MSNWYYGRSTSVTGTPGTFMTPPQAPSQQQQQPPNTYNTSSPSTRGWNDPPDLQSLTNRQLSEGLHSGSGSSNSLNSGTAGNVSSSSPAVNPFRRQNPASKSKTNLSSSSFSIFDPTKAMQQQPGIGCPGMPPSMGSGSPNHGPPFGDLSRRAGPGPQQYFPTPPPPPSSTSASFMTPPQNGNQSTSPPQGGPPTVNGVMASPYSNQLNASQPPPPVNGSLLTPNGYQNGHSNTMSNGMNGAMHQSSSQPCFSVYGRTTPTSQQSYNGGDKNTGSIGGPNSSQSMSQTHMSSGNGDSSNGHTNGCETKAKVTEVSGNSDCMSVLNYIIGNMRPKMTAQDFERLWGSVQQVLMSWNYLNAETKSHSEHFINSLATTNIDYARTSLEKLKAEKVEQNANMVMLFEYLLSVYSDCSTSTTAKSENVQTIRSGIEPQQVPMFSL